MLLMRKGIKCIKRVYWRVLVFCIAEAVPIVWQTLSQDIVV